MKIIDCKYCGKPLKRKYPSQKYHRACKKLIREEQIYNAVKNYYKRYGRKNNTIGTSNLSEKPIANKNKEIKVIEKEIRRIGLKLSSSI